MRRALLVLIGGIGLCSCQMQPSAGGSETHGRYSGIGVFDPGKLWKQASSTGPPSDPTAARLEDDEHIIVVVDSHSGEVRQCGDHSGYCIAMNPWKGPQHALPLKLAKHLPEIEAAEQK